MKKLTSLTILILCLVCVSPAAAYLLQCDCPEKVAAGETLIITGTSNLPPGQSYPADLRQVKPSSKYITQRTVTIQAGGDWEVTFPTNGLSTGSYQVSIGDQGTSSDFGSSSTCTYDKPKIFDIVDRSETLLLTSQAIQPYTGSLLIEGHDTEFENNGVEITVTDSNGNIVYGPHYISTDEGSFSQHVLIDYPDTYTVQFADSQGFVADAEFLVPSTTPTAMPTSTAVMPTPLPTTAGPKVSASASASKSAPAYFTLISKGGTVDITTSGGMDWGVDYTDTKGSIVKINERHGTSGELFSIPDAYGEIYIKVYPIKYSDDGTVTIYAQNAQSITVDASAASRFGETIAPTPTEEAQESPLSLCILVLAMLIGALFVRRQ